jgi:P27 family predicted phage terminase small subunit
MGADRVKGRKPKPTLLKILEGAQPCRINHDEPVIPDGSIEPPDWLDDHGKAHWLELVPILVPAGLLTAGDRPALAQLCDDFATIRRSIERPAAVDMGDWDAVRGLLASADKARDRYRRMLVEFGLTPSSRSRIKCAAEKPKDALEEFLTG